MKRFGFILLFLFAFLLNATFSHAQENNEENLISFSKKMGMIQLLSDTQQYSKAMKALEAMKTNPAIKSDVSNEVHYRLMRSRVYRLTGQYKLAMDEINKLPQLKDGDTLKLDVAYRKAALYSDAPNRPMKERMRLAYPIIATGITQAKALKEKGMLGAFYSLKASMHQDECRYLHRKCKENREIARECYRKAMHLFLQVHDSLNYHNTLNGLFRLATISKASNIDSLKNLVVQVTKNSHYTPNTIVSHGMLAGYYFERHDSIRGLKEQLAGSTQE